MLYYLMEELPYIPDDMQDQWFETEKKMLEKAVEAAVKMREGAKGLVGSSKYDFDKISSLYRIYNLAKLKKL